MPSFSVSADEVKVLSVVKKKFGPGNYRFNIDTAEYKQAGSGTEGIRIIFLAKHNDKDYKIFDNVWLTDKTKWKFVKVLRSVGLDPTAYTLETEEDIEELAAQLVGLEGTFQLRPEKGTSYCEPGEYFTPEQAELEVMGPFDVPVAGSNSVHKTDDVPF